MNGRRASLRPVGLLGLAWAAALLAGGPELFWAVEGRSPDRGERDALLLLGARHAGQGLLQVLAPHHLAVVYAGIDGLHAASMVVVAACSPRRRRAALISGAVAAAAGAAAWHQRPTR